MPSLFREAAAILSFHASGVKRTGIIWQIRTILCHEGTNIFAIYFRFASEQQEAGTEPLTRSDAVGSGHDTAAPDGLVASTIMRLGVAETTGGVVFRTRRTSSRARTGFPKQARR